MASSDRTGRILQPDIPRQAGSTVSLALRLLIDWLYQNKDPFAGRRQVLRLRRCDRTAEHEALDAPTQTLPIVAGRLLGQSRGKYRSLNAR